MADLHDDSKPTTTVTASDSLEDIREAGEVTATEGQPVKFENGFTMRAVMGALFVTFVMLPGGIYLGLVVGAGLGSAAEWVTILLFSELARRSFAPLKRQEIYILYLMAGGLANMSMAHLGLAGGAFSTYIWNVYFRDSAAARAFGLSPFIPRWVIPPQGSEAIINRTFWHPDWALPIALLVVGTLLGVLNTYGLGYTLFRITSDVERLPFPMAPVAAGGATALAEAGTKGETWRWRVFSIGAMVGIVFGFFHTGIPIFTGAILLQPVQIIPIPFLDLVQNTEHIFPAGAIGIDLGLWPILAGFVIPFPVVVGGSVSAILSQFLISPVLQRQGMLPMWRPGMSAIYTQMVTSLDFWLSLGIGTGIAIGIIGIASVVRTAVIAARQRRTSGASTTLGSWTPPPGRGDIPIWLSIVFWFTTTTVSIGITHWLIPKFPLWILLAFGYLYSPLVSYVSARMIGLTTRGIGFPMLREAVIIKSGYKGVDIWYANLQMNDFGYSAQWFREVELTGTSFRSILYMQMFMAPLTLLASFVFWSYFWHTNVIPSAQFPYAQKFWPLHATTEAIWKTANQPGANNFFMQAIKPTVILAGGAFAFALYGVCFALKIPVLYFYGFMGGLGQLPTGAFGSLFGAFLGRYYFAKKLGVENWTKYTPVLLAGFACGGGLISMAMIAFALIIKVTNYLPF